MRVRMLAQLDEMRTEEVLQGHRRHSEHLLGGSAAFGMVHDVLNVPVSLLLYRFSLVSSVSWPSSLGISPVRQKENQSVSQ